MTRRRRVAGACAGLLLATSSCVVGRSAGGELPPSPPTMTVTMREYRFEHPPNAPAGRVVFRVDNAGALSHQLVLVALAEDLPPIDQQLRGDTRQAVDTLVVVPARPPGTSTTFATELGAGRYAFICFLRDPDGVQHSLKGMSSEFRVA